MRNHSRAPVVHHLSTTWCTSISVLLCKVNQCEPVCGDTHTSIYSGNVENLLVELVHRYTEGGASAANSGLRASNRTGAGIITGDLARAGRARRRAGRGAARKEGAGRGDGGAGRGDGGADGAGRVRNEL